jgi:hypothetical protein
MKRSNRRPSFFIGEILAYILIIIKDKAHFPFKTIIKKVAVPLKSLEGSMYDAISHGAG